MPVGPGDWRSWQGAAINFALTRSVADTAALLDAMQVVQPAAVFQTPLMTPSALSQLNQLPAHLKIAYSLQSPVGTPVSKTAIDAVLNAVRFLSDQGFEVVEDHPDVDGRALMDSYYVMNEGETAAMFDDLATAFNRPITARDVEPLTWALGITGRHISAVQYSQALACGIKPVTDMHNFTKNIHCISPQQLLIRHHWQMTHSFQKPMPSS